MYNCFIKEVWKGCNLLFFCCGESRRQEQKSTDQKRQGEYHCVGKVEGQTVHGNAT